MTAFFLILLIGVMTAMIWALPLLLCWMVAQGMGRVGKFKYGEWILLVAAVVLWSSVALLWGHFDASYRGGVRDMEIALGRCGRMLHEGRRGEVRKELETLLASPAMAKRGYRIAGEFQARMTGARTAGEGERALNDVRILVNAFAAWLAIAAVWGVLLFLGWTRIRMIWLILCGAAAVFVLLALSASLLVNRGYFTTGVRSDLRRLARELERPEIRPELQKALDMPRIKSYSFFRNLPPEK